MRDGERFRLLAVGVGGQGVLTATRIFGEAALASGLEATVGQLHGMSQRGGSVESTLLCAPRGETAGSFIGPGQADVVLALEPLEAARARPRMSPRTTVIACCDPIVPFALTHHGDAYPDVEGLLADVRAAAGSLLVVDGAGLARELGSTRGLNIAMLGLLSRLSILPFPESALWDAIEALTPAPALEQNRRAYEYGREAGSQHEALSSSRS